MARCGWGRLIARRRLLKSGSCTSTIRVLLIAKSVPNFVCGCRDDHRAREEVSSRDTRIYFTYMNAVNSQGPSMVMFKTSNSKREPSPSVIPQQWPRGIIVIVLQVYSNAVIDLKSQIKRNHHVSANIVISQSVSGFSDDCFERARKTGKCGACCSGHHIGHPWEFCAVDVAAAAAAAASTVS